MVDSKSAEGEAVTQRIAVRRRRRLAGESPAPVIADRYRLDRRLGEGSSATVYAATDVRSARAGTIKLFAPAIAEDARSRARFEEQAAKAGRLKHPHIATILDAGFAPVSGGGEWPYVVTEPAGSRSLRGLLERDGRLSLERAMLIGRQLAAALSYAHSRGVIHANIKPENVLVDEAGLRVKLVDFSLSFVSARTGVVTSETIARRAVYLAPEQVLGDKVGPPTDVYGLAVLMYEAIAGRPPFNDGSPLATAERRVNEPARLVGSWDPTLPPDLESVLGRALERAVAARWAMVDQFDQALAGIDPRRRVNLTIDDPDEGGLFPAAAEERRAARRGLGVMVLAGAALIALALAFVMFGPNISGVRSTASRPTVPEVAGKTVDEARALAQASGMELAVVGERPSDRAHAGVVVQQSPIGGWRIEDDQPLRVTVSAGLIVPDVRGQLLEEATATLGEIGWRVGRVDPAPWPGTRAGTVILQHPPPGQPVPAPGELALIVAQ